ncbi:MAG: DNA-3-methyladenine glycosylase, partial [Acidimicrobiales bacterium]
MPGPPLELLGTRFRRQLLADPVEIAPRLLGKVLVSGAARNEPSARPLTAGRIVEVEAYRGAQDAASHA